MKAMEFSDDTNKTKRLPRFARTSQLHKSICGWILGKVTCVNRGCEMNCLLETPKLKFFTTRGSFYIL
jgi:hypothetical protein